MSAGAADSTPATCLKIRVLPNSRPRRGLCLLRRNCSTAAWADCNGGSQIALFLERCLPVSHSATRSAPVLNAWHGRTVHTSALAAAWKSPTRKPSTMCGPLDAISMTSMPPSVTLSSHSFDSVTQVGRPRVTPRGATQPTSAPVVMHKYRHRYGIRGELRRGHQEETVGPRQAFHGGPRNAPSLINALGALPVDRCPVVGPSLHRFFRRAPEVASPVVHRSVARHRRA